MHITIFMIITHNLPHEQAKTNMNVYSHIHWINVWMPNISSWLYTRLLTENLHLETNMTKCWTQIRKIRVQTLTNGFKPSHQIITYVFFWVAFEFGMLARSPSHLSLWNPCETKWQPHDAIAPSWPPARVHVSVLVSPTSSCRHGS